MSSHDPNFDAVKTMLEKAGYDSESLTTKSQARYTLQKSLGHDCRCGKQEIVVSNCSVFQQCRCRVRFLGKPPAECIYETKPSQLHFRYNSDRTRPIVVPDGFKFIGVKSDTGTGKTHQLEILLDEVSRGGSLQTRLGSKPEVLAIGPRILYNIEMKRKLSVEVKQFHSLWKFNHVAPKILVIDEAELNRKVWTDQLNKIYQHRNQEMLELLVRNADLVLVMDATLTQETIDILSMMDPSGKWFVQENTFQSNKDATIHLHASEKSIISQCVSDMSIGKIVSVASGSLKKLDSFRAQVCALLPASLQVSHKTFNSKTPGKAEDFEVGLDKALGTTFTMLYTGCMGVGVEYTTKYVDKRYVLVNYNIIGADGYLQMLGRVRNPIDQTVEMLIQKPIRTKDTWLPTTRRALRQKIEASKRGNLYIKNYYKPYLNQTTRKIQFAPSQPWVEEAYIANMIQRNKSLNNMESELRKLLEATGYTIEQVCDSPTVFEPSEGCKSINLDIIEDVVAPELQTDIEVEVNLLSYDEQVEQNLRYWSNSNALDVENKLREKYVRYRVEFPSAPANMQAYLEVEGKRSQLFNLACMYKLQDQNALQNYLIRNAYEGLQHLCLQLSAMKILFAALTEQKDVCTPPELLQGHVIENNMKNILDKLRATNFVTLIGVRVQSETLKMQLCSKTTISAAKGLVPAIIGLTNQAMNKMFGCTYENTKKKIPKCRTTPILWMEIVLSKAGLYRFIHSRRSTEQSPMHRYIISRTSTGLHPLPDFDWDELN